MKLSVLLPVYNECATLREIVRRVRHVPLDKEIIIVDNASTDGTREVLLEMLASGEAVAAENFSDADFSSDADDARRIRIAFQSENGGKGKSVRRALELARGEFVIVQDADLEYDPQDYLKLLALAQRKDCCAVFGTRLGPRSAARRHQPRTAFYYGRIGLSLVFRVLYGSRLTDVATCYKLIRREVAQSLPLQSNGFDLDFEIAARLARRGRRQGQRILEAPISYAPRTELEGKKIRAFHDGWRAVWALLKYRF